MSAINLPTAVKEEAKCLHDLFEEQVEKTPDRVALEFEDEQLSYRELNERANQVARFLSASGIRKGVPLGILMDRSLEMVIAIWGLLKIGGVYVPLDTELPESRLEYIAKDTAMLFILTRRTLVSRLPQHIPAIVWEDAHSLIERESTDALSSYIDLGDLAYIVYTSGSTGQPKGVLIPHRVFTRCHFWATEVFRFTQEDRFLLNFFRAPEELFYPLLIGARLFISPPGAEREMRSLVEVVSRHRISVLGLTPSMLSVFIDECTDKGNQYLKHVYCAGEALPMRFQERFFEKLDAELYNFYGLAEAPYSSIWKCKPKDTRSIIPIGRPVDARILILDDQFQPVHGETVGELFIGGPGLAIGYLNQAELSDLRFVKHQGERFYRSGDLAHYDSEGQIILLGRSDHQVQIRGLRVELGEIEAALRQQLSVDKAVVELREEKLIAYLKLDPGEPIEVDVWRSALRRVLPDYMIPSAYVVLSDMPYSLTGKTDRKALPTPLRRVVTDLRVSELSENEREQLLVDWNDTAADYPNVCVHQLFEAQVERSPEAVAVVFEGQQLTYHELNEQANRLSHCLINRGVEPGALVAICVERSFEMLVGLLGILKAGAAYVPLDPDYPQARLAFMLEDCGKPLLVTSAALSKRFAKYAENLLILDDYSELSGRSAKNPGVSSEPEDLAYIIYTSGSTGCPKGVEIPHRGVVRLVCANDYCRFDRDRVFLQFAPASFDAATFEIWGALLHCARLVVAPPGKDAINRIPELVAEHGITTAWLTAGLFNQFVDDDPGVFVGIEELLIGGEALSPKHVSKALMSLPDIRIINGYGPTETTTFASTFQIERGVKYSAIPIGKPIANTKVYILDDHLHPVPIGVAGELFIGGAGLARGYLNRPELTAERFVEIEILGRSARVYRTGDLCRWRADGNLEFLGRLDQQVKIRGFRIELGEIETVISAQPGINESAVLVREDRPGEKSLVAYYVSDRGNPVSTPVLRRALAEKLPDYMLPVAFVLLDRLPLTTNGKLDRRALPAPELGRTAVGAEYTAPQTSVEEALAAIWEQVLGLDQVGIHDNFFELGGHSLLVARLVGLVNERLGSHLLIGAVYRSPTIAGMVNLLKEPVRANAGENLDHGKQFLTLLQEGSGEGTIILVGGLLEQHLKNLPSSAKVLHLGLDGFGRGSFQDLSVDGLADAYADELETLSFSEPVVLVGHSYGGLLAYALAHTLNRRSARKFELVLLEPTWLGSDVERRKVFLKRVQLVFGRGPGAVWSALLSLIKQRWSTDEVKGVVSPIDTNLNADEPRTGAQLYELYKSGISQNARNYRPSYPLKGRVYLASGARWQFLHSPSLIREYLETSPILIDLGEVDHLQLVNEDLAASRWLELVCDLVSSNPSMEI